MSEMKVTSCDGCNEIAPGDYDRFVAGRWGWVALDCPGHEALDACSWECVATIVAAKIAEGVDA